MMRRSLPLALGLVLGLAGTAGAQSLGAGIGQNLAAAAALPLDPAALPAASVRNGQEIFSSFRDGLAEPTCNAEATSPRWQKQFAHAPSRLANQDDDALVLFGYVVEELRKANLPTEFALIPFVESGYRPNARNGSGPTGLWQFIATTARNHRVPMANGYDGRLSAVDSTQAAVRYLKTLHGMFGGDWRLATMAYNAGEYRVLQSMRKAGMNAQNAKPSALPGLSPVTHAYVEKLHALACVLEDVEDQPGVMASLDRTVPVLKDHTLPAGTSVQQWAAQRALDPARIARLNPPWRAVAAPRRVPPACWLLSRLPMRRWRTPHPPWSPALRRSPPQHRRRRWPRPSPRSLIVRAAAATPCVMASRPGPSPAATACRSRPCCR
ncbi:Membrane-bound lytic murein transglycosylase D precursor [Stenotrophomonas maltophilia D457]|nr:Membrane-bound lytic murein transglycosylase D precursor [Stenotrophomonas maltophilia D457]